MGKRGRSEQDYAGSPEQRRRWAMEKRSQRERRQREAEQRQLEEAMQQQQQQQAMARMSMQALMRQMHLSQLAQASPGQLQQLQGAAALQWQQALAISRVMQANTAMTSGMPTQQQQGVAASLQQPLVVPQAGALGQQQPQVQQRHLQQGQQQQQQQQRLQQWQSRQQRQQLQQQQRQMQEQQQQRRRPQQQQQPQEEEPLEGLGGPNTAIDGIELLAAAAAAAVAAKSVERMTRATVPANQQQQQHAVAVHEPPATAQRAPELQGQQQQQQLGESDKQRILQLCDALAVHLAASSKAQLLQALARIRAADELPATVATGACSICKESLKRLSLLAYRLEPQVALATQLGNSGSSSKAAKAVDQVQGIQRLVLCHTCYLKASAAAAATAPEACGFELPSSRHARVGASLQSGLLVAQQERLLSVPELLLLEQLAAALPVRLPPAYKLLWQRERPHKLDSKVFIDAAEGQQGGGKLWLTHSELQALLSELLPDHVYHGLRDKLGYTGSQPAAPQQLAAAVMAELERSDRQPLPYFQCSVQDGLDQAVGIFAAEREAARLLQPAAVQQQQQQSGIASSSSLPSSSTRVAAAAAARHEQQLRQQAADAQAAGDPARAAALNVLATTLRLRYSRDSGCNRLLCNKIVGLSLLLVGMLAGTSTVGHINPAGAATYAFALLEVSTTPEHLQQMLQQVLARWLFISPAVFACIVQLRRLLWLLDYQRQRQKHAMKCEQDLAKARISAAAQYASKRRAEAAVKELHQAEQALQDAQAVQSAEQLEQRLQEAVQQQRRAPLVDRLTAQEEKQLEQLLGGWWLSADAMPEVAAFMGSELAVLVDQCAGEGVLVKVGWMHFVTNLQPCLKIAFEVLRPADAPGVLQMQRYLRCACPKLGDDYMRTVQHVVAELLAWAKAMPAFGSGV